MIGKTIAMDDRETIAIDDRENHSTSMIESDPRTFQLMKGRMGGRRVATQKRT